MSFFTQKEGNYLREGDYSREAIISNNYCSLEVVP